MPPVAFRGTAVRGASVLASLPFERHIHTLFASVFFFLYALPLWQLLNVLQGDAPSAGPLPATPGLPRGFRSLPTGLFQNEKSAQRASDIYFILLLWAIVLVQVWLNLWILQLLPIPVAGTQNAVHRADRSAARGSTVSFLLQCGC